MDPYSVGGAELEEVRLRVASILDFLIMKAHAIAGRDKPKDAYGLCYCLDHFPGGLEEPVSAWRERGEETDVKSAIRVLREKFASPSDFGPMQFVEFFNSPDSERRRMEARRAFELVQSLLSLL